MPLPGLTIQVEFSLVVATLATLMLIMSYRLLVTVPQVKVTIGSLETVGDQDGVKMDILDSLEKTLCSVEPIKLH